MKKYNVLVNILDEIRMEAIGTPLSRYNPDESNVELVNQARARAFIHLYLKVGFGLLDFKDREHYITDGAYDGGIDGYYIHKETKIIYFIQSKFRTNETNFEKKKIELEEILAMDIDKILSGDEKDEQGNEYNGKIKQLVREIGQLEGIARYTYKVILLANLSNLSNYKIQKLVGGYDVQVIDFDTCYKTLVFPVISGTYFNASDVNIYIDLSNKNAGSKISYTVQTKRGECEITVLFIPTIEIAKIMHKYKNSILKFNPRSYLEHEGQRVNNAIKRTILSETTNEFALFNNGITMLSDETYINERIGQRNKAQLTVRNPQIINGGQTAYTLSKIYQENLDKNVEDIFLNKEVLIKIITFFNDSEDLSTDEVDGKKSLLIDEISTATNQQTVVINADRFANEEIHKKIQKILFDRYGILYERKRGEFNDGLENNYISKDQILERNLFFRIHYATLGKIEKSIEKRVFYDNDFNESDLTSQNLDTFYFGFLCFQKLFAHKNYIKKDLLVFAEIFAFTKKYMPEDVSNFKDAIKNNYSDFKKEWITFINEIATKAGRAPSISDDYSLSKELRTFVRAKLVKKLNFAEEALNYFGKDIEIL